MYNIKLIKYYDGSSQITTYSIPYKSKNNDSNIIVTSKENVISDEREYTSNINNDDYLEKLERSRNESVRRSKTKLYRYARANKWDYFLTLTFNETYVDRYDLQDISKITTTWFNGQRKRNAPDLKYLIVPEQHKNGAWHLHGLVSNIDNIRLSKSGKKTNKNLDIYNLSGFKYGFTTATTVIDSNAVSKYVTKYITKELCDITKGKKRYWCSRNLELGEEDKFLFTYNDKLTLETELEEINAYYSDALCKATGNMVKYYDINM